VRTNLRLKCPSCHHWNRVQVDKIFVEKSTSEPKVKAYIPFYKPLEFARCEKCGKVIAEPQELIRIDKTYSYSKTVNLK
jgi:phage FluMu protein Com